MNEIKLKDLLEKVKFLKKENINSELKTFYESNKQLNEKDLFLVAVKGNVFYYGKKTITVKKNKRTNPPTSGKRTKK